MSSVVAYQGIMIKTYERWLRLPCLAPPGLDTCIEVVDPDGGGMDEANVKKFLSKLDI
jgi:hypothetical protein